MKKTKIIDTLKDNETMLNQKTNEDFNKKPPVPKDFKENKPRLIKVQQPN